jgi:hypothetical protein
LCCATSHLYFWASCLCCTTSYLCSWTSYLCCPNRHVSFRIVARIAPTALARTI